MERELDKLMLNFVVKSVKCGSLVNYRPTGKFAHCFDRLPPWPDANVTFLLWQRQASKYLVRFEENPANVTFLLWQRQASKYLVRFEEGQGENSANVTFLL